MALPRGSILPGSRRARLLQLLRNHAAAAGEPLSFAELLTAYRSRYDDKVNADALHSPLGALLHGGEVVRAGHRSGRLVYQAVMAAVDPLSDVRLDRELRTMMSRASKVVATLYQRHGTPIPTAWISNELKRRRLWPDRFQRLTLVLERLEESSASADGSEGPSAVRRVDSRSIQGAPRVAWVPAAAPARHARVPQKDADAVRLAIDAAAKSAGRPVSPRELRWWLLAQLPPTRLERSLSSVLRNAAYRDRERSSGLAVRVEAGPLCCHGGAPHRYYVDGFDRLPRDACRITDAAVTLRVAQELAGIEEARAQYPMGSGRMNEFVARRADLLLHAWRARAGHDPANALALAIRAAATTAAWGAAAPRVSEGVRQGRAREAARILAHLRASEALLCSTEVKHRRGEPRPRGVGEAATITLGELRRFSALLASAGELRLARPEAASAGARRFPVPSSQRSSAEGSSGELPPGDTLAVVDRVDAIVGLVQHANARSAGSLIAAAAGLLGHVVRDTSALIALLDRFDECFLEEHAEQRRHVVVAIGLLGTVVEPSRALSRRTEAEDAKAYVLSLLCATWRADITLEQMSAAPRRVPPAARRELRSAAEALWEGRFFGAIDRSHRGQ